MIREPFGPWSDGSGPFMWFWIVMFSVGSVAMVAVLIAIATMG